MLLYYITDRKPLGKNERQCRERLLEMIAEAARAGIDYIQLREKDLSARDLEKLTLEAVPLVRAPQSTTRLLLNSRVDVALAAGADGVHLTSQDISPVDARKIWSEGNATGELIIAVSCHTDADVMAAENAGADFVVFGPVFEKAGVGRESTGIVQLRNVCRHVVPVVALGGVTRENARSCIQAGAKGVAGIRLFQEGNPSATVAALRKLK